MAAPNWPGMMKRATAARYCDLSIAEFEREVQAGRLPMPVKFGNHDHWAKARIDDYIEAMSAGANDWRRELGLPSQVA